MTLISSGLVSCGDNNQKNSSLESSTYIFSDENSNTNDSKPESSERQITSSEKLNQNNGAYKYVALTFDDGPRNIMPSMVNKFIEYDGKATFFCIGKNINENTKSYLQYAIDRGFEIGNHSDTHDKMTTKTKEEIQINFLAACEKLRELVGYDMRVVRLPYLSSNATVASALQELGLPMIGTFESPGVKDYDANTTLEYICTTVFDYVYDGAIICMHEKYITLQALDTILPELTRRGYKFVTVSELFEIKGYKSIPLGEQLKKAVQQ